MFFAFIHAVVWVQKNILFQVFGLDTFGTVVQNKSQNNAPIVRYEVVEDMIDLYYWLARKALREQGEQIVYG